MDAFASILSAEMAKKKSAAAPKSASADSKTGGSASSNGSKYIRRADVEKARQEQYLADQARLESERAERALKKRKADEEAAAERERQLEKRQRLRDEKEKARLQKEQEEEEERKRKLREKAGAAGDVSGGDDEDGAKKDGTDQIDEAAAVQKLRELNEPIRLFGESNAQRVRRINRLTGVRKASPPPLSGGELLVDPKNVTKDPSYVRRQLLGWFRLVVSEWQIALAGRDEELRESYQGRQATTAMTQAIENLQPLFKHLQKGDIDEEIFAKIVELVVEAQARRYVRANDVYLRLSIGNAAWPIGVTMVGIHERSAREKLHEKGKSAHIMSDEATRKYLQSIKRCLNFAQTRWPPEDPMQIMG
ncbi:mRNA splicing protein prp18 [Arthrobotrys musiformis]|uniref:Pre-mRNA-splicing factor 18 n=1 Tax=Arthrobotrys musiformis TaxID=47236 RepID=A0AAV9VV71_9PEZI